VPVSSELVADSNEDALNLVGASLVRDLQIKIDASFYAATTPNGPNGLGSLTDVQVVDWGSITDLDCFATALSMAEVVGSTITSWSVNPVDALELSMLKSATDSRQPLLGMDPTQPTQRLIYGVPVISSAAVEPGQIWGIPVAKVFTVVREDVSVVTDSSPYFSSDRWAVRATMRVGYGFPHEEAIVRIDHGGS